MYIFTLSRSLPFALLFSMILLLVYPASIVAQQLPSTNAVTAEDQFKLGRMYARGEGVTQSFENAGYWYRKAADAGNTKAMNNLGILFLEGQGTTQNNEEGYRWIRAAAEKSDPHAMLLCGTLLCQGRGVAPDSKQGVAWITKAADGGYVSAIAHLADDYLNEKDGVSKDPTKAISLLKLAASKGDGWSCRTLSALYSQGSVVPLSREDSNHWLEIGAMSGDSISSWLIAEELMKESPQKAYPWFRLSILLDPKSIVRGPMLECIGNLKGDDLKNGDIEAQNLYSKSKIKKS